VAFLSASQGYGYPLIRQCCLSATRRVTTGELNRFVETLHFEERNILYITQAGLRPPSFVLFTDKSGAAALFA
jgi:GTP-binding protein